MGIQWKNNAIEAVMIGGTAAALQGLGITDMLVSVLVEMPGAANVPFNILVPLISVTLADFAYSCIVQSM